MRTLNLVSILVASIVFVACDATEEPQTLCQELGHLCHPYDLGAGPGHDCHEVGHEGVAAACEAQETSCRAICSGPIPDGGVDSGP